jgi:uncharacterized membrane protein YfcA
MSDTLLLTAQLFIALFSGMIQGAIGFGFVLVAAPLMSILVDPKVVVPAIIVQRLATGVPILLHAYRHLRIRRMWALALAGMAGVPAGTLVLLVLNASLLRLLIGVLVVTAAVAMMLGFRKPLRYELAASVPVGFASGTLSASTGLAGPPVIFFYTNQGLNPREFRANIVAHFAMLDIITLPSFIIGGLYPGETVLLSAQLLPATLAGVIGGIVINRWVSEMLFRRVALVLILIAGIMAVLSGIAR